MYPTKISLASPLLLIENSVDALVSHHILKLEKETNFQNLWRKTPNFESPGKMVLIFVLICHPVSPYASLGISAGVLFLIIACLCCCCCRFCCRKKEVKKKAKDKMDLKKYQLFGPNYYEKVQPGQDEIDYNVEASEKETDKDIQLG